MSKPIYLDYASATPLDSEVLRAMQPYFKGQFYNTSATYLAGRRVKQILEAARADVAQVLGARPAEIIFTAGATEANNLAIQGVMRHFPSGEILTSAIEHESVLAPSRLFKHKVVPVSKEGIVDLKKLAKAVNDSTVLVSVMLVNNEIGSTQPLKEVVQLLRQVRKHRQKTDNNHPIYLHTDAAQAGNFLDLHVSRLGVDLMSINGGKIYGPKASGTLFIKAATRLDPLILGGGQESGWRSGTENLAASVGLARALQKAQERRPAQAEKIAKLRTFFANQLQKELPEAVINGSFKRSAPHILNVTFPGVDNERLMMELDEAGVMTAVGSACSASSLEPSHVLAAIGKSQKEIRASLRFSLGRGTTEQEILSTVKLLRRFT